MTPYYLQTELRDAVYSATKDLVFKDIHGHWVPLNVYEQNIPITEDDSDEEPFPYCLVRVVEGVSDADGKGDSTIHAWIVVAVFNDDLQNIGHRDVLGIMSRVSEQLCKVNVLPHFRAVGNVSWKIQETNTYPFFYGGMEMDFVGTAVRHQNYNEELYT